MEFSGEFKYRKYWLRTFIGILGLLIIFPVKDLILSNFIRSDAYLTSSLSITMVFIFFYYKSTRIYFVRNGRYNLNNNIEIYMNNKVKIIKLDNIKEISYMKRSILGEKYILVTIVQKGEKTIKIMSDSISNDYDISRSPLYEIYKFIQYNAEHLENAHYNNSECFVLEKKKI